MKARLVRYAERLLGCGVVALACGFVWILADALRGDIGMRVLLTVTLVVLAYCFVGFMQDVEALRKQDKGENA